MALEVGSLAPSFQLYCSELKQHSLSDYKGKKVVLHFFPLAFTGVCTTQLCTLRDRFDTYQDQNIQVLAVSVDSPFTLAKFKEEQKFQFPLLSDFNKNVSEAYGSLYQEFVYDLKGVSKRSAFVVNEEGLVVYAEVLESAGDLPNFAAIEEVLKS